MDKINLRYYQPKLLVTFILTTGTFVSLGVGWIVKLLELTGQTYYQFPTAGAIVIMILTLVDKRYWNRKLFHWLYWVPNMSGRYEGRIDFFHPISGIASFKNCALEVIQTGSKIKVNSYFEDEEKKEKSPSKSLVESIVKGDDGFFSIVFTYQNEGIQGVFPQHYGTNAMKWIDNGEGTFLKGDYYTNREPQTKGTLSVKLISQTLKNDY